MRDKSGDLTTQAKHADLHDMVIRAGDQQAPTLGVGHAVHGRAVAAHSALVLNLQVRALLSKESETVVRTGSCSYDVPGLSLLRLCGKLPRYVQRSRDLSQEHADADRLHALTSLHRRRLGIRRRLLCAAGLHVVS